IRDFHVTGVQTCALPIWPRIRTDIIIPRLPAEQLIAYAPSHQIGLESGLLQPFDDRERGAVRGHRLTPPPAHGGRWLHTALPPDPHKKTPGHGRCRSPKTSGAAPDRSAGGSRNAPWFPHHPPRPKSPSGHG